MSFLREQAKAREERQKCRDEMRQQLCQPPDDLKLFFDSMYETTKKLRPNLRNIVKRKLFAAVSEAEDMMDLNVIQSSLSVINYDDSYSSTHSMPSAHYNTPVNGSECSSDTLINL